MYTLAALFSLDAFAGGFVVQSMVALWLYQRFDLSLAAAGMTWWQMGDSSTAGQTFSLAATFAQNILPDADANATEQQAALGKLAANLGADAALFAADLRQLASVGALQDSRRGAGQPVQGLPRRAISEAIEQ